MKRDQRIGFVLDEATKQLMEDNAAARDMSLSEFIIESSKFYGSLDPGFVQEMQKTAREMGVKTNVLLMNLVIDRVAMAGAFQDVFRRSSRSLAGAFEMSKDGQMLTGDALSKKRTNAYRRVFRKWRKGLVDARDTGEVFQVSDVAVEAMAAQVQG